MLTILFPFVAGNVGHIYDFTQLLFMAALLGAMAAGRQGLYLVLFTCACFNKETTIFASIAYAFYFVDHLRRRTLVAMLLAQALIFGLIYFGLRRHYAGNPGQGMENWAAAQMAWLGRRTFSEYLAWTGGILLVAYRWPEKPVLMRRAAWVLVPHLALIVTSAYPGEVRNLYESLPILSLFVLRNVALLVSGEDQQTS
jgi:hypothetical protein